MEIVPPWSTAPADNTESGASVVPGNAGAW
jgi:hypothetical protein